MVRSGRFPPYITNRFHHHHRRRGRGLNVEHRPQLRQNTDKNSLILRVGGFVCVAGHSDGRRVRRCNHAVFQGDRETMKGTNHFARVLEMVIEEFGTLESLGDKDLGQAVCLSIHQSKIPEPSVRNKQAAVLLRLLCRMLW